MRLFTCDYREPSLYRGVDYLILDPPWNYDDKPPKASAQVSDRYSVWSNNRKEFFWILSHCEVKAVFLWITNSMEEQVLYNSSLSLLQYRMKTQVTWVKVTKEGKKQYGLGNSFRNGTEQLKVFVREGEKAIRSSKVNWIREFAGGRTRKPKLWEASLIKELGGTWRYVFAGPYIDSFSDLPIDCVDICYGYSEKCSKRVSRQGTGQFFLDKEDPEVEVASRRLGPVRRWLF